MDQQPESFKMRLDAVSAYQLDALAAKLGLPRSTVMRLALRAFAKSEDVQVPQDVDEDQGKAAA
jgi:predicted transcriptional regulator